MSNFFEPNPRYYIDGKDDKYHNMLYIANLVNKQQNINNRFVNLDSDDLAKLAKKAHTYDMSEIEIIEMILDLNYA